MANRMANLSFNVDTNTLGDPIVKILEHATGAITLTPDTPAPMVETVATAPVAPPPPPPAPKRVAPSAVIAAPAVLAPVTKRRGRPKAAKPETVGASAAGPVPAPAATKQRRPKDELATKLVANALSQAGVDGASCEELRGHLAWAQDKTPALRNITASLIERGAVYKTGERRSTRYFLTAPTNGAGLATSAEA